MNRPIMTMEDVDKSLDVLRTALLKRLDKKGYGSFASTHEIYSVMMEEVGEVEDEMRANNEIAFADELIDVAVTTVFGHACLKTHSLDKR